ncbi:MAG: hypothetical protein GY854_04370 [Deltaproteobacteria bacterium]|nr:hypothetical protein [Deltaproteobacteria bacterium]
MKGSYWKKVAKTLKPNLTDTLGKPGKKLLSGFKQIQDEALSILIRCICHHFANVEVWRYAGQDRIVGKGGASIEIFSIPLGEITSSQNIHTWLAGELDKNASLVAARKDLGISIDEWKKVRTQYAKVFTSFVAEVAVDEMITSRRKFKLAGKPLYDYVLLARENEPYAVDGRLDDNDMIKLCQLVSILELDEAQHLWKTRKKKGNEYQRGDYSTPRG